MALCTSRPLTWQDHDVSAQRRVSVCHHAPKVFCTVTCVPPCTEGLRLEIPRVWRQTCHKGAVISGKHGCRMGAKFPHPADELIVELVGVGEV
eukprot:5266210-Prymnesium_polylepis.1